MPGFDGTGPQGMGPMTGGGRGFCNPYFGGARAPYTGTYGGAYTYGARGFGRGFGRGRGFRFSGMVPYGPYMQGGFGVQGMPPYGQFTGPDQEIEFLRDQAKMLKQQIEQIDSRIQESEKTEADK